MFLYLGYSLHFVTPDECRLFSSNAIVLTFCAFEIGDFMYFNEQRVLITHAFTCDVLKCTTPV